MEMHIITQNTLVFIIYYPKVVVSIWSQSRRQDVKASRRQGVKAARRQGEIQRIDLTHNIHEKIIDTIMNICLCVKL